MLYSESKERENRFKIALKISLPFLILTILFFYVFKISSNDIYSFVLFLVLIPIYIYYVFYLIYSSFKFTLVDDTTKTFTRKEILKRVKKYKKKGIKHNIILIKLDNIVDINDRYGIDNADKILKIFINKLDNFFKKNSFNDILIGRYGGGNFLVLIKGKQRELNHLLRVFSSELKNIGINHIEIKIKFSMIELSYDKDVDNIIKKLFSRIDEDVETNIPNIKPNELEKIICDAIDKEHLIFKFQPTINKNKEINLIEILVKIYSKNREVFSQSQIQRVVNHVGYETIFDKKILKNILKELEQKDINDKIFTIKLSPVSLRNSKFILYLKEIFSKSTLKPENFVLEFCEKNVYSEINRFKEILNEYKKLGFKIGLNNFGGNNCSLEYIKYLPIDIVKFDIEFSKNLEKDRYQKILKSYKELLNELGIKVMIKFIDKNQIFELAKKFDFDYIQGFVVSKPKTLKEIVK